ncbi:MAG: efflux RND transporter periplasmic adaptor subunit [Myxococcota bacterium]
MNRLSPFVFVLLLACETKPASTHVPAAQVSHPIAEADLPTVRLSPAAVARLKLETTQVKSEPVPRARLVGGEVVVPPGRTVVVTAPVAGEVHFVTSGPLLPGAAVQRGAGLLRLTAIAPTDRDTRARVAREVAAAEANLAALELRVTRNQALIEEGAGSARALEEAVAARAVAQADADAARARATTLSRDPLLSDVAMQVRAPVTGVIRLLAVAEGQAVAAGAPLFELVDVDALQVRVPVYSGDLARLDPRAAPRVRRNGEARALEARFVPGPPTAEPDRSTVDRYLSLPAGVSFAPGERVLVELPLVDVAHALVVPASAVVLDAWGGAWVYRCEEGRYTRARVDAARRAGADMVLARGPAVGSCIVSVGAVELFGAEFPPGH